MIDAVFPLGHLPAIDTAIEVEGSEARLLLEVRLGPKGDVQRKSRWHRQFSGVRNWDKIAFSLTAAMHASIDC